jgi:formamidopyrimidine-DNA glycosylase
VSDPKIWGVANGYLQDILFHAGLHPRHRATQVDADAQRRLHAAIRCTLEAAILQGGRESERDLFNQRGGYARLMDSKTKGQPCPTCGTAIEKISYLGGSCYFCPNCQT